MKEDFVTYGLAVKLKEKGYPQVEKNTLAMYDEDGCISYLCPTLDVNRNYYIFDDFDEDDCVCPTIYQVLKWLRDEKQIHISIMLFMFSKGWCYEVVQMGGEPKLITTQRNSCDTYEKAALAGIEFVVYNLI